MLQEDQDKLKDLLMNYTPQQLIFNLKKVAFETAVDLSDEGLKEQSQNLLKFSISLEEFLTVPYHLM